MQSCLRYAVCSTRCGLIISRCVGACNGTSSAEERRPQLHKTSHLILEMSMNEAFIWLSGLRFIDNINYYCGGGAF